MSTPKHYKTEKGIDVIEFCNAYELNFNRGNIVKYVCRAGRKEDELKDLEKAMDYLMREIEFIKQNDKKIGEIEIKEYIIYNYEFKTKK